MKSWYIPVLVAASVACYYNSLNCGFVFDDIIAIQENKDLRPETSILNLFFNDFWGMPMFKEQSHKSYRPITVLTFRWNYWLNGLNPIGYHLVNAVLHVVVTLMYYKMCNILVSTQTSFVAALLFAVHPVHTEAVTGVVGRAEILSSVFFLGAFLLYVKSAKNKKKTGWRNLLLSMLAITAAMLCKEQGVTIAAVCVVYEILVIQKVNWKDIKRFCVTVWENSNSFITVCWSHPGAHRLLVVFVTTLILLSARFKMMGSRLPVFNRYDNPASQSKFPTRHLTYNYLLSVNFLLMIHPSTLVCDWTMGTIPLIESISDPRNVMTIATYLFVGSLCWMAHKCEDRKKADVIWMALALMALPFIPATNLFFPVGFVVAERVLYMPSMGFCLLVAYGFQILCYKINGKVAWSSLGIFILIHGVRTHNRNVDWETEYSLFMSGLKVTQNNAKLYNNVGHTLEGAGDYNKALKYYHQAVKVQEDDIGAYINVGRACSLLNMSVEAESAYLKAKSFFPKPRPGETYTTRIPPHHLNVFLNLANLISKNDSRLEEADLLYRQAISMRSDYTQAYINRGDNLVKMNRNEEAQASYEKALLYDNKNPDIYYNLGVTLLDQGKTAHALTFLDKALELNPDHQPALLNSAILLTELGDAEMRSVARKRFLKLLPFASNADKERVYFNLGMLAMDELNSHEAVTWFKSAIELKEDFRSALFNIALLLSNELRPLEAAPFLHQLMKHYPDHLKGLILLGDIYINALKDLDVAEECYKQILAIDPTFIQGVHNLCVVYVERGRLSQAEACLHHTSRLAPEEDYIFKHLNIIEARMEKLKIDPHMTPEKEIAFAPPNPVEFGGILFLEKIPLTTVRTLDGATE